MMPPDFSCGVRFEMRSDYLRATGLSHPDFKVTQRDGMPNKVKTFCFCGGTNGGRVKFTHYQDAFGEPIITLDGHETLERESTGRPLAGNFGLLCQTVTLDSDAGEDVHGPLEHLRLRESALPRPRLSRFAAAAWGGAALFAQPTRTIARREAATTRFMIMVVNPGGTAGGARRHRRM